VHDRTGRQSANGRQPPTALKPPPPTEGGAARKHGRTTIGASEIRRDSSWEQGFFGVFRLEQVLLECSQTSPKVRHQRMNTIDVNRVLSQIRSLQSQAANRPAAPVAPDASQAVSGGFGALLKSSIDSVASTQNTAGELQKKFELGDPNTDLASVMLATSKSQVSFKAMVEVRNRMVSAYQDIMNMPL